MSKAKITNVAYERVKSFVDRLEKMEEERQAIGADIRDIYSEAKGNGFDVKTLRWLVSERKVEASDRAERDALRATYANALSMAVDLVEVNGLSLRDASKRTGIPKSNIHRALSVPKPSQPAPSHDEETGEIKDPVPDAPVGGGGTADTPDGPGTSPKPYCRECEGTGIIVYDDGGKIHGQEPCPICRVEEEPPTDEAGAVGSLQGDRVADPEVAHALGVALKRAAESSTDDGLDIPTFLRRSA